MSLKRSNKPPKCAVGKCKNKALPNSRYCSTGCGNVHKPKAKKIVAVEWSFENMKGVAYPVKANFDYIPKRSAKRAAQEREYLKLREKFLNEEHICPVTGELATEVHHKKGRIGKLLTDVRYFLGVSRTGHEYIETHPEEAYEKGWSLKRNQKTE